MKKKVHIVKGLSAREIRKSLNISDKDIAIAKKAVEKVSARAKKEE